MGLDIDLVATRRVTVSFLSTTHNLIEMAAAAGIYGIIWRPEENDIHGARDLIEPLKAGLARLKADPDKFKAFNPSNGWGSYDSFVEFVQNYLNACEENPDAAIEADR